MQWQIFMSFWMFSFHGNFLLRFSLFGFKLDRSECDDIFVAVTQVFCTFFTSIINSIVIRVIIVKRKRLFCQKGPLKEVNFLTVYFFYLVWWCINVKVTTRKLFMFAVERVCQRCLQFIRCQFTSEFFETKHVFWWTLRHDSMTSSFLSEPRKK